MNELPTREVLIFNAALQLPAKNRAGYLSENCQDDAELHRRVVALLEAHERAGAFLQEPRAQLAGFDSTRPEPPGERCGEYVGRYKLLQQVGEGGCGVVYMAEQEEPVR